MKNILSISLIVIFGVSCNVTKTSDTEGVNDSVEIPNQEDAVEMKIVTSKKEPRYYVPVKINKEGIGSIPFNNSSGKLLFKYEKSKIYLDKDNDGKFEGADATPIPKREIISVPIKINGKDYDYKFKIPFGQPAMIYLTSMSHLEGEYKGRKITLIDKNFNGDFSEVGVDMINYGTALNPVPIGDSFRIGSALFDLQFKDKGRTLLLKPYGGPVANVKMVTSGKRITRLTIQQENSKFTTNIAPGEDTFLVPGDYKIVRAASYVLDPNDNRKQLDILFGRGGTLKIAEGDNVIKTGSDLKLEFDAYKSSGDNRAIKIKSVSLIDNLGVKYSARLSSSKGKSKLQSFIRSGNKEKLLSTMEYG